jgi:accessory gene regulator B
VFHKFAGMIAHYLIKNETIDKDQEDIYVYGYEIILSSITSLSLIIILGVLLHQIPNAIIFYIVFVITRLYSGGYHASSYLKCNTLFVVIFLCTLAISKFLYEFMSLIYLIILLTIYVGSILEYAPIDNDKKRLTKEDKLKYRKISISIAVCLTIITCILYFLAKEYATTLTITLVMIALLMLIEINKRKELIYNE